LSHSFGGRKKNKRKTKKNKKKQKKTTAKHIRIRLLPRGCVNHPMADDGALAACCDE